MDEQCNLLDNCGFFTKFSRHSEVVKQGWISNFCKNIEKSKSCKRRYIMVQTGKPPVDSMTPTGLIL